MPRFKCSICGKTFDMGATIRPQGGKQIVYCPDCNEQYMDLEEELEELVIIAQLEGRTKEIPKIIDEFIEKNKGKLEKLRIKPRTFKLSYLRRLITPIELRRTV